MVQLAPAAGASLMAGAGEVKSSAASSASEILAGILRRVKSLIGRNIGVIALILLWQIATMWAQSFFFPTPIQILSAAADLWLLADPSRLFLSPAVFVDVIPSIARLLVGWGIAVVLGVTLGLAIGRFRRIAEMVSPSLEFLRALPSPALIPIFLIILGTDSLMRVCVIVLGSVWPVLLNSIEGFRTVDRGQIEMARVFGLPASARLFRIIIPSAAPQIFGGMRVSLSIAIILMVVSELVASSNGIGHAIIDAQSTFQPAAMWANISLLALLGIGLNGLFSALENRALAWHHASMRIER
jgi:ABC-type nitrate/sulfonate/bicarbonate transport system permease component